MDYIQEAMRVGKVNALDNAITLAEFYREEEGGIDYLIANLKELQKQANSSENIS